jgi:hypothetical protein
MLKEIFVLSLMLVIPLSANAQIVGDDVIQSHNIDWLFVSNDVGNSYVRMIGTYGNQSEEITFYFSDLNNNVVDQYTHVTNYDGSYEAIWRILDYLPDGFYYVQLEQSPKKIFEWKSIEQFNPSISIESTVVDDVQEVIVEPIESVTKSSDIEILDLRLRILQVLESIFKMILG